MKKVVIIIDGGAVESVDKPDDIEVEIRDYDLSDFGKEHPDAKQDEDGSFYQEMIFPAKEPNAFTDVNIKYHNSYKCPKCGYEWEDYWGCSVDDECGECGFRHISPYQSEKL